MANVVFGAAARAEVLDVLDWYAARSPELAADFATEIEFAVGRILDNPLQFPVVFRQAQRARLRRFPYSLFFTVDDDDIYVLACFHAKRNPRRWKSRL